MAYPLHKLSALDVKRATAPGNYRDGGGLFLQVRPNGGRYWLFEYMLDGKSHVMGLGSARDVTLADARKKAGVFRNMKANGACPLTEKKEKKKAEKAADTAAKITFGICAEDWLKRNTISTAEQTKQNRESELRRYARALYDMPVSKIEPEHVADLFRGEDGDFEDGLWVTNHMIAKRVLNQVLRVFKDAILRRKRPRPNPADDIKELLPKVVYKTKHRAAVPFKDLAAFIARLRAFDRIEARALEFVILTAARVNTVALMTWGEIDGSVWTAPAEHMKGSKDKRAEHRCPLSDRALEILRGLPRGKPGDLVFLPRLAHPRSRGKGHIKLGRSIHDFLRGPMGEKVVTIHGFRASFSQWCDDVDVSPAVSEQALAHVFGNRVSQAYKEGSEKRFKQRIPVMQAWADYCTGKVGGDNVVQFAAAK